MERCKYVELQDDSDHDLEKIGPYKYKLKELTGQIVFCESFSKGLIIRISNHQENTKNKDILWCSENNLELPAFCEQELRCFYKRDSIINKSKIIYMLAFELMNKENSEFVIRRGKIKNHGPEEYEFREFT